MSNNNNYQNIDSFLSGLQLNSNTVGAQPVQANSVINQGIPLVNSNVPNNFENTNLNVNLPNFQSNTNLNGGNINFNAPNTNFNFNNVQTTQGRNGSNNGFRSFQNHGNGLNNIGNFAQMFSCRKEA